MKKIYLMLFILLSLGACKKDALAVDEEKSYLQTNASATTDPMFPAPIRLTLKPNGIASIAPSGSDIVYSATYKMNGDKITVTVNDFENMKFKFTVISDLELHGENGEILKLDKN